MRATNLKIDYLINPIGLVNTSPKFYWNCEGGKEQSAYQIVCVRDEEVIWDSGKCKSGAMTHILYAGKELKSRDVVNFTVMLWDENDIPGDVAEGHFEIGLLNRNDFIADWITGDYNPARKKRYPVDYFKKEITISSKVKKARIYASALGLYDIFIGDNRIEDFILAPGITDYRKRVQYQTYDVTNYFKELGIYDIKMRIADGWYRGSSAAFGVVNVYGNVTALFAQIEILFEDGTTKTICTGRDWQWSNDGPIRFADLKDGEHINANLKPSYAGFARLAKLKKPVNLVGSGNVYVTEHERFKAKLIKEEGNIKVFDFGQNIAGYLEFEVKGAKDSTVRMFAAEVLDENGFADITPMQETRPAGGWTTPKLLNKLMTNKVKGDIDPTPRQEVVFVCSGDKDHYKTSFSVFGFRYVQVEGEAEIALDTFESIAIYSDLEQTGDFTCSDERINKLVENTRWSMKGNFLDIPTDCPTRERLGWTGDAQIFFNTGAYFMDTAAFFRKWLTDMEDAQYENGLIPAVLPYEGVEMMYKSTGSSVGWADAVYLVPYRFYKRYGDVDILKSHWQMMRKYGDYLLASRGFKDKKEAKKSPYNDCVYEKGIHLGEWLEPVEFRDKVYGSKGRHPEECTAYLYYAMKTLSEIADIIGENSIATKYREAGKRAKEAYIGLFMSEDSLRTNRQAKLVRPIALGILDDTPDLLKKAQDSLEKAVEAFDYRVGTGFLSTPFLLKALSDAGKTHVAYKVLLNEKKPGWLYEVLQDSTTVWEYWEGKDENGKGSFNHYSPGAVCEWLFNTTCGIIPAGERFFEISPIPGDILTEAKAVYKSLYGEVRSAWKKEDGKLIYTISIPSNCTAEINLQGQAPITVKAGVYTYDFCATP
ncbi:MAG: family 78 glycoside hydrolase catalytic domain [Butyrivibrio sp.]|nr:family 78 glycoside hydrolase catalytic domain [Butyrivibrio sp.]